MTVIKTLEAVETHWDQCHDEANDWLESILTPLWEDSVAGDIGWKDTLVKLDEFEQELDLWRGLIERAVEAEDRYWALQSCKDLTKVATRAPIKEWVIKGEGT